MAAAAVLVIGISIGRMTSPVPDAVPAASAPGDVAQGLRFAAAEHFGRTESLLTRVRADVRRGQVDPMTGTWARGLLAQTRLLIDARVAGEPAMDEQVIFVASQRNEPEVVDFLMEVACDEEDKELRERALFWLGQSKDPRVAEFLLSLIRGRGVNRLYGPRPRGSSGLDLLW